MLPPVRVSYAVLAELADGLDQIATSLADNAETAVLDFADVDLPARGFAATRMTTERMDSVLDTVQGLSVSVTDVATAVHRVVLAYAGSDDRARRRSPW